MNDVELIFRLLDLADDAIAAVMAEKSYMDYLREELGVLRHEAMKRVIPPPDSTPLATPSTPATPAP